MASTACSQLYCLNPPSADSEAVCRIGNISPAPATIGGLSDDISSWSAERRFQEAAKLAIPKLPKSMQTEFAALFSGQNLVIMAIVFGAWAASHAFGVGEAFDLVMLVLGLVMIGPQVWTCARDLA